MNLRTSTLLWSSSAVLLLIGACSSDPEPGSTNDDGGAAGTTKTAGGQTGVGGKTNSGGTTPTSGGATAGGTTGLGGAVSTAGNTASAGTTTAGGTAGAAGNATAGVAGTDIFAMRCPAQPADLFQNSGAAGMNAAGAAKASTATRPQLSAADADALYTVRKAFEGGGDFTVTYSGTAGASGVAGGSSTAGSAGAPQAAATAGRAGSAGSASTAGAAGAAVAASPLGVRTVVYAKQDNWDPATTGIGDVTKIVPGYVVAQDGTGTHTTIQSAIDEAIYLAGCTRAYIRIKPGIYREKITIPAKTSSPPLALYSTESDASKTVIVRGNSAAGLEGQGASAVGMTGSATFTLSLQAGFQAKNITIANDYVEGTYAGTDQAAVALLTQGDRVQFENVRILGNRNALYVKSTSVTQAARAYFRDSYIEGDEEFIIGRGTVVFDHCKIHSLGARVPTGAAIAAPSTRLTNPHGFLFVSSDFTADTGVSGIYLGKQWYESNASDAVGKIVVRNSNLGAHISAAGPWAAITRVTPKEPAATTPMVLYTSDDYYAPQTGLVPPEVFLAEYGNSGLGAAQ